MAAVGKTILIAVKFGRDLYEFKGYLGNVGKIPSNLDDFAVLGDLKIEALDALQHIFAHVS